MSTSSSPSTPHALVRFLDHLGDALANECWVKLSLGSPSQRDEGPQKWLLKPTEIRGERRCLMVARWKTRDETQHIAPGKVLAWVAERLQGEFRAAVLWTETAEHHLDLARKPKLRSLDTSLPPAALGHDRVKSRKINASAGWLNALGVTDAKGQVRMKDKFRQIERFMDLLDAAFRESALAKQDGSAEPVRLCDMGSGKGYLTFAAADFLQRHKGNIPQVVGIEMREELVALCNDIAQRCNVGGLRFLPGTIEEVWGAEKIDILVALHACNTATDEAIAAGVRNGAEVILVSPCCHKEARGQVDQIAPDGGHPLHDLLRHGLFAERQAEMVTDALRVLYLERAGYRVKVAEFVAAEHTAKNVMISAIRLPSPPAPAAQQALTQRIEALKELYGIRHHRLEELLVG